MLIVDQLFEFAFAGHHISQVEASKLVLTWGWGVDEPAAGQVMKQPIVKRTLIFELEGADAVRDVLERIFNGVRKGIHRVNAPGVTRVVMRGMAYAINRWVAHIDIGAGHVDFGAQNGRTIGQFTLAHVFEPLKVFADGPIPVRTVFTWR